MAALHSDKKQYPSLWVKCAEWYTSNHLKIFNLLLSLESLPNILLPSLMVPPNALFDGVTDLETHGAIVFAKVQPIHIIF